MPVAKFHQPGPTRRRSRCSLRPTRADKKIADKIAEQINAKLVLGEFAPEDKPAPTPEPILFGPRAREWHRLYSVTFKSRFHAILENHLVPYFGERDLREISEADLLEYSSMLGRSRQRS